ncbi:LysE family translocator [Sessilibacter sp. MAH4]
MIDFEYWSFFFVAALALNLSPGPDLIYVLTQTISGGKKVGVAAALGACSGAMVHVCAAALGVSAVIQSYPFGFKLIKYLGAAYLVYLAIQAFKTSKISLTDSNIKDKSPWQAYKHGVLIDLFNPKVAIFFLSFLPQFVRKDTGHAGLQMLLLGAIIVFMAAIVEVIAVQLAGKISSKLRNEPKYGVWLNYFVGFVFTGLAVNLLIP